MDWGHVASAVAGGGLVLAKGAWDRLWQRRDKREDRGEGRDDEHRDQLRIAYAEFIAAYTHFLGAAMLMQVIGRTIDTLPGETFTQASNMGMNHVEARQAAEKAVSDDLRARGKQTVEDFAAASTNANTRAVAVLLIEDEPNRRRLVLELANSDLIAPQDSEDYDRFEADVHRLRAQLQRLTAELLGAFSPQRWHSEVAARRKLQDKRRDALPSGE